METALPPKTANVKKSGFIRIFYWLIWSVRAQLRRLRHNWGQELVALVAVAVFTALFVYMFRDFLTRRLTTVSESTRQLFMMMGLSVAWMALVSAVRQQRRIVNEYEEWMRFQGEFPPWPQVFRILLWVAILTFTLGIWIWLTHGWYELLAPGLWIVHAVLAAVLFGIPTRDPQQATRRYGLAVSVVKTDAKRSTALQRWRLAQMFGRDPVTHLCLVAMAATMILLGWLRTSGAPSVVSFALALVVGILSCWPLTRQCREDLNQAWIDRSIGVSHQEFIGTYRRIAYGMAVALALLIGIAHRLGPDDWLGTLQIMGVAITPLLLCPDMLLQIDGRRPAVTMMVLSLAGLFLGTAVFVHIASLALVGIAIYYAGQYQRNFYYRAS